MDDDLLERRDPAYGKRAEFRELIRAAGRRENDREFALLDGAMNLLCKAIDRQAAGETEQADRLVARAAAMPYNSGFEASAGVFAAQPIVYDEVSDWLEYSDADDQDWLTACIAAHARMDEVGAKHLASAVHGFVLQTGVFETTRTEERLIRVHFSDAPLNVDLGDGPDLTPQDRERIIRSLLDSYHLLVEEYQRTG